jgi:hypothetical protein
LYIVRTQSGNDHWRLGDRFGSSFADGSFIPLRHDFLILSSQVADQIIGTFVGQSLVVLSSNRFRVVEPYIIGVDITAVRKELMEGRWFWKICGGHYKIRCLIFSFLVI